MAQEASISPHLEQSIYPLKRHNQNIPIVNEVDNPVKKKKSSFFETDSIMAENITHKDKKEVHSLKGQAGQGITENWCERKD